MEHHYYRDAARDENEKRDRKLNAEGYRDTGIPFQKPACERASRNTRKHCEPTIGDGKRSFVDEQSKTANAS